ncbi:hypothetical protein Fleli_0599 [Bernardetia litoralis DSM 6794]|uniref:Secreted protein n=1 Tax=Bernardetia litoralis (strain ATCC 23117 / DSM 6794 / NBRC 15988 / NCIMB 1366 / Fx l1 / Sio-4) TaxID=880071 RepID=I4AGH8_BERLS|nr:hypothetical protein [Bernardetia litoralis]AFM03063.1 hypothetical protein Fleli_0599 [Bernardetia litoralis DSM 6794]
MKRINSLLNAKKTVLTALLIFTFVFGFSVQASANPIFGGSTEAGGCNHGTRYVKRTIYVFWIAIDNGSGWEGC